MQLTIKALKELVERCDENSKVYVHIKEYENYEQFSIIKISSNPIHLNFEVKRQHESTIKIAELKEAIKRYDENSLIQFMIMEPEFQIQRGGAFDSIQLDKDKNLHFFTYLGPRIV